MAHTLLPRFIDVIRKTDHFNLSDPAADHPLLIDGFEARGRQVRMLYAPFDHINRAARIVIVGMTPGGFQAQEALSATRAALAAGRL